ncbi:DUF2336 domain-containing protein [Caulobacter sp. 17J80-11]|uniref:DUF2336 domain-containing protein n=1 Tax=Caulobacter sp. 17J80-11 TaxID=2763502 RepID=UPI001653A36D|nr:DUF2336 domain-containing protein [Caulobacter sp. 17J80-11]MBC6980922.1 DUF2336 domain-containing protein [Caulobacter sp. 17J80-11]
MTEPAPAPESAPAAPPSRARKTLLKRLADVVCLPASRVNAFERAMTADLLVEMLREAEAGERAKVAGRLAPLTEVPNSLTRLLLRDEPDIARILIDDCGSLTDADLVACAREASTEHRRMIAARRGISEVVSEVLVEPLEPEVLEALLKNTQARLSQPAMEALVGASRHAADLIPHLLRRPELRPSGAYVMFWWCDADGRRTILSRFAVSREVLQEAVDDVFALGAEENWSDPLARKALQFIERRQRNRAAIEKSPYDSLEAAVAAAEEGITREIAQEIGYLSGLKPATCAKLLADRGGEPLAVLCKATGLPKSALKSLWRSMKRPETEADGSVTPALERVLITYEMIATDRAQTVLRYWNWALSSALTPALVKAIREGDEDAVDEYSVPQRAAMLALAEDFGR